jgi:DNA-binding LacI/PurR family transcriptional regulator
VSKSLVSLVLRGKPGVSDARRHAVLKAAHELGYRPNAAARSLVQQRTHTVGALLSDMGNPWFIDLLDAVRSELAELGLNLFLSESHQLPTDSSVLDAFIEARVEVTAAARDHAGHRAAGRGGVHHARGGGVPT